MHIDITVQCAIEVWVYTEQMNWQSMLIVTCLVPKSIQKWFVLPEGAIGSTILKYPIMI
jgi:isoprenylcysteine carboxyl methyltransferase (ICMT) family protein YpbQ